MMILLLLGGIEFAILRSLQNEKNLKLTEQELTTLPATSTRGEPRSATIVSDHSLESGIAVTSNLLSKQATQPRKYARIPWFWLPVAGHVFMAFLITRTCFDLFNVGMTGLTAFFLIFMMASSCIGAITGIGVASEETSEDGN